MKHKNLFKTLFAAVMVSLFMPLTANAQIQINEDNFPDKNFRNWLLELDYGMDGMLMEAEIQKITKIDVSAKSIVNLKGIEYFTALQELYCNSNELESLDVSKNTALTHLECQSNHIRSLDISGCVELTYLNCYKNPPLPSLDVSKNTALTYLNCGGNEFTSLDLSNNVALTYLDCWGNQLTSLDVSNHTELTTLICSNNQLTSLYASRCNLTTLSFDGNPLDYLNCSNNQLTSLDVSKNTALTNLYCGGNQLTSLDVHNNTILINLGCQDNQLTSLDVSKNTALTYLDCGGNEFTSLDLSNNVALSYLDCWGNQLTSLDVSNCTELTQLNCSNNQLTALDVSNNTALTYLSCFGNQLIELDVSKNTVLDGLYCRQNMLTSLDVSKNTALRCLYCESNQLIELNVSYNIALKELRCYNNQLTKLNISHNTALTELWCYSNEIKGDAMDDLISSLPQNETNNIYPLYVIAFEESDNNICTKSQVAVVKGKGWTPYHYYYSEDYNGWKEYEGSDDDGDRKTTPVSINYNGIATYCPINGYGIDFRNATKIAAYKASSLSNNNIIVLEKVDYVAAGEGVLIRSLNGGEATEDLPIDKNAKKNEDNVFIGTTKYDILESTTTENGINYTNYVLSSVNGIIGFYIANNTPIYAGKAYLRIKTETASGPALVISFNDDNTTGIIEIIPEQSTKNDAVYTLSGVRVNNPTKGIYIKNGKKVVIK